MDAPTVREQLIRKLDELTDEQVSALLSYAETMLSRELPPDYDPDKDPLVGFFSGDPDLASRTQDILDAEFGLGQPQSEEQEK